MGDWQQSAPTDAWPSFKAESKSDEIELLPRLETTDAAKGLREPGTINRLDPVARQPKRHGYPSKAQRFEDPGSFLLASALHGLALGARRRMAANL